MSSETACTHSAPWSPGEQRRFRDALGTIPTGVVITTARTRGGNPIGMTMNSFASVSLDPPLVLFCIDRRARGLPEWERAAGFAINVLSQAQARLSSQFARPHPGKWDGVRFSAGLHGAPLLADAIACFECVPHERFEGGDHRIVVGRVERFGFDSDMAPLLFHRGRYGALAEPDTDTRFEPAPVDWPLPLHY
jgi:flavin reductase (DIM6/NTAB) family NADH-FMN oxidoreductase RutF